MVNALRKIKHRKGRAAVLGGDSDEGDTKSDDGEVAGGENVSTVRGLFVTPSVIAKCKAKDIHRNDKKSSTAVKQKASSLKKSFLEITAYSLLPSFLDLIDEDSAAAKAKEQQQEENDGRSDDEEEQEETPAVGEQHAPAFMRMELKKLQLLARIFMGVRTAAEINTKVKLRDAIGRYLLTDGAIDFLRAKILPSLNL